MIFKNVSFLNEVLLAEQHYWSRVTYTQINAVEEEIKDNASIYEYFPIIRELCSKSGIKDEALIHYVINGINDPVIIKYLYIGILLLKN